MRISLGTVIYGFASGMLFATSSETYASKIMEDEAKESKKKTGLIGYSSKDTDATKDTAGGGKGTKKQYEAFWSMIMDEVDKEDFEYWSRILEGGGGAPGSSTFSFTTTSPAPSRSPSASPAPSASPSVSPSPSSSPAPSVSPSVSPSPSSSPSTSMAPSNSPTDEDDCFVLVNGLESALQLIFDTVEVFQSNEILNQRVPLFNSSFNSLIGGEGSSIDAVLDLRDFLEELSSEQDIISCRALENGLASSLAKDGTIKPHSSTFCDETEGPVSVSKIDLFTTTIDFCSIIDFKRPVALDDTGLFRATGECIEVEISSTEFVSSKLKFGARLTVSHTFFPFSPRPTLELDPIEATLDLVSGTPDLTLFVGMLNLECTTNMAEASAFSKLTFCKNNCDVDLIGDPIEDGASFYIQGSGDYDIKGVCRIGDEFPGVELSGEDDTTAFEITESDIFSMSAEIDVLDLKLDDFLLFCPENAISLLRAMESTVIRTQRNEAMDVNLPLTNISYSETLQTGSIIMSQLLRWFVKVEDFEKRYGGSVQLAARNMFNASSGDFLKSNMTNMTLEFYYLTEELTVNPEDSTSVRDLASVTNGVCAFQLDEAPIDDRDFRDVLANGINEANCSVTACAISDCMYDNITEEFFGCLVPDCDVVVDVVEDELDGVIFDKVVIASVSYSGERGVGPKDVQLIGLYEDLEELQGPRSLFEFPINQPVTPSLVPRFRTFRDFATRIEEVVRSRSLQGVGVAYSYVMETVMEPSRFEVSLVFEREVVIGSGFDTAASSLGDLENIRVASAIEEETTNTLVAAKYAVELMVILAPNESEIITVLGTACDGNETICDLEEMEMAVEYVVGESPVNVNFTIPQATSSSPIDELSAAFDENVGDIASVASHRNTSLFFITFDRSVSRVRIWVPKECVDVMTKEVVQGKENALFCEKTEISDFTNRKNVYGLQDQDLSRKPFYITVQQSSITANFSIDSREELVATIGTGSVEVETRLDVSLVGDLNLQVGSGNFLPFCDWLIAVSSIFQPETEGYVDGFLQVSSVFDAKSFSGNVKVMPPFDHEQMYNGRLEKPFEVNFVGKNSVPPVILEVNIPGGVPELTFETAVDSLSKAVKFVLGDLDPRSVDSCSGGLLGNELVSYQIPLLGVSACSSVHFLQVLIDAVDALEEIVKTDAAERMLSPLQDIDFLTERQKSSKIAKNTLTSIQSKLETLLSDSVDKAPLIRMNARGPELEIELELDWTFKEANSLNIDLTDIVGSHPVSTILGKTLVASNGDAMFGLNGGLALRLGLRARHNPNTNEVDTFILGGPILMASFSANGTLSFEPDVGPLSADALVSFGVGNDLNPLQLELGLPPNEYILDENTVSLIEASFSGSINGDIDVKVPLVKLEANINFVIEELNKFFQDPSQVEVDIVASEDFEGMPDLFELLLAQRDRFVDALDDVIGTIESVVFGNKGVVTRFRLPFLRNGIGSALGANTDNNIFAQARRKVIPKIRDTLDEIVAIENVTEVISNLIQDTLDDEDLIPSQKLVQAECFARGVDTIVGCSDVESNPTSVMWTVPLGQRFEQNIPLDFCLTDDFPLELSLEVDKGFSLTVSWDFKLAFGFDDREGFFLYTFPNETESELAIKAKLSTFKTTLDASLFFLSAEMNNTDLNAGADVFVNIVNEQSGAHSGVLTRSDFRKISDFTDFFKFSALVGASVKSNVTLSLNINSEEFSELEPWIPTLGFDIEAQFDEEVGNVSDTDRMIAGFTPSTENVAKITNVGLELEKISEFVSSIIGKVTNYMDNVIGPLEPIAAPLPGISDIAGRDITVVDIAEIFVGKKSGSDTVRDVINIYTKIKRLAEAFSETERLILADQCNLLEGFNCTGGLIDKQNNGRLLQECDLSCRLERKAKSVDTLDFPILSNPLSALNLLQGGDVALITFKPPKVRFAFEYELETIVYTPPTVRVGIAFEFVATLEAGLALDSKGIREAIEQQKLEKALNSFALIDAFDGVDTPMITLTGSVAASVSVSAVLVEIGVSGGIQFIVTIDLFDPNPQTSNGLVRPYELLSSGSSPLEWFEFSLRINIFLRLYIRIIIDLGFFGKFTLFSYSKTFTTELIDPITANPMLAGPVASLDVSSGILQLGNDNDKLACTSFSGSFGNELLECVSGNTFNAFSNVKQIDLAGLAASGRRLQSTKDVTLRGVQSEAIFSVELDKLELDYTRSGAALMDAVLVRESQVLAGPRSVMFQSVTMGKMFLPQPEEQLLVTTFGNCSNSRWELEGHSNLRVNANDINEGCEIIAKGGDHTNAQLTIDFGSEEFAHCEDGNKVSVTSRTTDYGNCTRVVISRPGMDNATVDVGLMFTDLVIKMSNCNDEVLIEGTAERLFLGLPVVLQDPDDPTITPVRREASGSVSIYGFGGSDQIIVGSQKVGLDEIHYDVIVDGGTGNSTLIVDDFAGSIAMECGGQLDSGSLANLLNVYACDAFERSWVDYVNIDNIDIRLGKITRSLNVISTARGSRTSVTTSAEESDVFVYNTRGDIDVIGGDGMDRVFLYGMEDGASAIVHGNAGDDQLWLGKASIFPGDPVYVLSSNVIRWSGGADNDTVHAFFTTEGLYSLDIVDDIDGINTVHITCEETEPCMIWSRENFVAKVNDAMAPFSTPEKVSIDHESAYVHLVILRLNGGENMVLFDDTFATMAVFGGPDKDVFHIGRIHQSPESADAPIDLTETTEGFVSHGNSHPVTINANFGNDEFRVLRNTQLLDLNGESGDDMVVVKSHLASSETQIPPDYVVNSLVDFSGGTGEKDSLVVMGTQGEDSYVVSAAEIFGGGLSIKYKAIKELIVGEAEDQLTILSTDPDQVEMLLGQDGRTPDSVNPLEVDPVASKNLRGHRGIIRHDVSSDDPKYNKLYVEGLAADVLDNDGASAYINVVSYEELHFMSEDAGVGSFSFLVYPSREPNGTVAVDIVAPLDLGRPRLNGIVTEAITLTFDIMQPQEVRVERLGTSSFLFTENHQMIKIRLNTALTTDERFKQTRQSILPVDITVIPGRNNRGAKSVSVVKSTESLFVTEGMGENGITASYDLVVRPCPDASWYEPANITLRILADASQVVVSPTEIDYESWVFVHNCTLSVAVSAVDDETPEGDHFVTIRHELEDADGNWTRLRDNTTLQIPDVVVRIYDNDSPGVIVRETQGSTSVIEFDYVLDPLPILFQFIDSYSLRLTSPPDEGALVNISMVPVPIGSNDSDPVALLLNGTNETIVQSRTIPTLVSFNNENWNQWQSIFVVGVDDEFEEGVDYLKFPPQPQWGLDGQPPGEIPARALSEMELEEDRHANMGHSEGHPQYSKNEEP